MIAEKFCWCDRGAILYADRREGYPLPHKESPLRQLTDEEWAEAMTMTPHAAALTAERSEKKQT